MLNNKSIIYFDTGTSGYGGSFTSLSYNIKIFSSYFKRVYLVYLNESKIFSEIENENVIKIKLDDVLYQKNRKTKIKLFNKMKRFLGNIFPFIKPELEFLLHKKTIEEAERKINFNNIELIHFNIDPLRDFFGYKLCLKYDIPAVFHLRVFHEEKKAKTKIELLNSNNTNRFIAISNSIRNSWLKLGFDSDLVESIPNFIEFDDNRKQFGIKKEQYKYKLLFVGRVEKNKGIDFLLDVFYSLSSDYVLYIVGDGNYLQNVQQRIVDMNIEDRVYIEGFKDDTSCYMSFCDILVIPSMREPFGRVVLEGFVNKIPVIATRVGGMVDIIDENLDGLFVEYGDVQTLKQKIELLRNSQEKATQLVENAFRKVQTTYSENNYKMKLLKVYNDLLE
ncbi:MAG: glycosyltransferase family 4 protein [Spirochaetaceae bacterium]|nr:glycosyltransferase family 4 protein [Spirochaetaceae bacterium]MCF7938748.1 glycosyltransferase family 4 protein [Spirochaetales bacterium]